MISFIFEVLTSGDGIALHCVAKEGINLDEDEDEGEDEVRDGDGDGDGDGVESDTETETVEEFFYTYASKQRQTLTGRLKPGLKNAWLREYFIFKDVIPTTVYILYLDLGVTEGRVTGSVTAKALTTTCMKNLQTSGIFVCSFSFSLWSVTSLCSVQLKELRVMISENYLIVVLSCWYVLFFISNRNLKISCLFRLQAKLRPFSYENLGLHIRTFFYTLYESLGLHTRTYIRIYLSTNLIIYKTYKPKLYVYVYVYINTISEIYTLVNNPSEKTRSYQYRSCLCHLSYLCHSCLFRMEPMKIFSNLSKALTESPGLHIRSHIRTYFDCLFINVYANNYISQSNLIYRMLRIGLDLLWLILLLLLCGDVELNPGPFLNNKKLVLMTQNCRGLNNVSKLKEIINRKKRLVKRDFFILATQETYLIDESSLNWCGKYVFSKAESTHSAGCITFLPDTVKVIESKDIDERGHGHFAVVEGLGEKLTIIGNIYAPVRSLVSQQEDFYEAVSKLIEEMESKYILYEPNLIIMGDFNIPFEPEMTKSAPEKARALALSEYFSSLGLIDCWKKDDTRITLKGGQSRLDRILYRTYEDVAETIGIDWTFTASDHCLVSLVLEDKIRQNKTRRVTSLPIYILNIAEEKSKIMDGLNEFHQMINDNWGAHTKLEFLKTGLRTVVGEVIKLRNRKEREELEKIQTELERRMVSSSRTISLRATEENTREVEILFNRRNAILESKCDALAAKAKTKWFHEGEKSNKYFLNLLRKRGTVTEINKLVTDDGIITNEGAIQQEISKFYKDLYEKGGQPCIDATFFTEINKVQGAVADSVIQPILKDELFETLKTCKDSAPGPDGIPYAYYKHFWCIFGDIMVETWSESLATNSLPPSHKNSILRLLPKEGKDLTKLTNWRPITLSNCDHKLITKCYANRLTRALIGHLHPNQTAYLPGKQIQDNLRLIDIINKKADNPIIAALDAKKAFDSVTHDYIREVLRQYGLESFINIFDLLYNSQRVDIAINNDVISGYGIKNGVKQGDSLSCILFILCIDPLIRNIESNMHIGRVEIGESPAPKILAYADDVTCITDSKRGLREIFKEYERLSRASGLILNADKTEILDGNSLNYSFKYMHEKHRIKGKTEVKINGIIFHCNGNIMKTKNYERLLDKINSALQLWKTRRLSLLGKILIYKTYGLSQILYVLTVVELDPLQYKSIQTMFNNFLWGRDLYNGASYNRLSWRRLSRPIEMGGFGMINFKDVVNGIRCRQLGKMFDDLYNHPLKNCILHENKSFASWTCLKENADTVAMAARDLIHSNLNKSLKKYTNDEIISDNLLLQQLGELEAIYTIKINRRQDDEVTTLVHHWGCNNFKEIVVQSKESRSVKSICRRLMIARYFRVLKLMHQRDVDPQDAQANKIKLANNCYKYIYRTTSKDFRLLLSDSSGLNRNKLGEVIDEHTSKSYFAQIKRLVSTKHKNTLLRVWNGDCLSYSRLIHYGVVDTNRCPKCNEYDSPEHMLITCLHARTTWELLQQKIPKRANCTMIQYAMGINDTCTNLMIKAEVLKYIMHFRELQPESIINKTIAYLKVVNARNREIVAM